MCVTGTRELCGKQKTMPSSMASKPLLLYNLHVTIQLAAFVWIMVHIPVEVTVSMLLVDEVCTSITNQTSIKVLPNRPGNCVLKE